VGGSTKRHETGTGEFFNVAAIPRLRDPAPKIRAQETAESLRAE